MCAATPGSPSCGRRVPPAPVSPQPDSWPYSDVLFLDVLFSMSFSGSPRRRKSKTGYQSAGSRDKTRHLSKTLQANVNRSRIQKGIGSGGVSHNRASLTPTENMNDHNWTAGRAGPLMLIETLQTRSKKSFPSDGWEFTYKGTACSLVALLPRPM